MSYATARLVAAFCAGASGSLSVGVLLPPDHDTFMECRKKSDFGPLEGFGHGDAGIVLLDCRTGKAATVFGYLADKGRENPSPSSLGKLGDLCDE